MSQRGWGLPGVSNTHTPGGEGAAPGGLTVAQELWPVGRGGRRAGAGGPCSAALKATSALCPTNNQKAQLKGAKPTLQQNRQVNVQRKQHHDVNVFTASREAWGVGGSGEAQDLVAITKSQTFEHLQLLFLDLDAGDIHVFTLWKTIQLHPGHLCAPQYAWNICAISNKRGNV